MEAVLQAIAGNIAELVGELAMTEPEPAAEPVDDAVAMPITVCDSADWVQAVNLWLADGAPRIGELPARACPACGSTEHRWLFRSYDGYPFHECLVCGVWFVPHRVTEASFAEFFARCPEAAALCDRMQRQRLEAGRPEGDVARVRRYLDELTPLVDAGGAGRSCLDIGCGVGHSLLAAGEVGFQAHGVEVSSVALSLARSKGVSVSRPGEPLPGATFGLLCLWETLEHLDAPGDILSAWLPHLAPGGLVAITLPNLNAPAVRLLRGDCPWIFGGYQCAGHINLFHVRGLERLLQSSGLTVLDVDGQYSNDWRELISYCQGLHRGAHDRIAGREVRHRLSQRAVQLLDALAPAWSLIDRLTLAAPILKVVACRQGEEHRFRFAAAAIQQRRREDILHETDALQAPCQSMVRHYETTIHGYQEIVQNYDVAFQQYQDLNRRQEERIRVLEDALCKHRELIELFQRGRNEGTLRKVYRRLFR